MVDSVTGQDTPVDFSGVTRTEKEERYIQIKRDSNWQNGNLCFENQWI